MQAYWAQYEGQRLTVPHRQIERTYNISDKDGSATGWDKQTLSFQNDLRIKLLRAYLQDGEKTSYQIKELLGYHGKSSGSWESFKNVLTRHCSDIYEDDEAAVLQEGSHWGLINKLQVT